MTRTNASRDRSLSVPGLSQLGHVGASGWCSPASVAMVLQYWAKESRRDDLSQTVPEVAAGVYDRNWPGTGNWPFNTAYAGSFAGMRAYVTRFDSLWEVEEWIAAGVPVILSAPYNLLSGDPQGSDAGHVVVCTGFTATGDVRINDPFTRLNRGQSVARIYQRGNVEKAWRKSDNTVYLIYPIETRIPRNTLRHWETIPGSR